MRNKSRKSRAFIYNERGDLMPLEIWLSFAYIFLKLLLDFICRIISLKEKTASEKPGKHTRKR